jgi:hypothetical protein
VSGDLETFNHEYKRRRRIASGTFPSYQTMLARYRAALASSIAGNVAPEQIIAAVFGERS